MQPKQRKIQPNRRVLRSESKQRTASQEKHGKREIDLLLGSGVRSDVLRAFFRYPGAQLGSRELQRITDRSLSEIQRNLGLLEKIGLLERFDFESMEGGTQWVAESDFLLNKSHPWVAPLQMLIERSIGGLSVLAPVIEGLPDIDIAFVFGSYATSEQGPYSDIDLMVIGKQTLMTLAEPISEVEKRIGREIQIIAYSPEEWRSKFESQSHFVVSLMNSPKFFLVGDQPKLERITFPVLNEI